MKRVIFFLVFSVTLVGCEMEIRGQSVLTEKSKVQTEQVFNLDAVVTVGNHSYIPINVHMGSGNLVNDMVPTILNLLDNFEKKHPELEVTGWNIQQDQRGNNNVYGLWVNHKPKP